MNRKISLTEENQYKTEVAWAEGLEAFMEAIQDLGVGISPTNQKRILERMRILAEEEKEKLDNLRGLPHGKQTQDVIQRIINYPSGTLLRTKDLQGQLGYGRVNQILNQNVVYGDWNKRFGIFKFEILEDREGFGRKTDLFYFRPAEGSFRKPQLNPELEKKIDAIKDSWDYGKFLPYWFNPHPKWEKERIEKIKRGELPDKLQAAAYSIRNYGYSLISPEEMGLKFKLPVARELTGEARIVYHPGLIKRFLRSRYGK